MSQAELSTFTDVANHTAANKLMVKSRRGSGLNVANLAAYSQLAANEGLKLNRVAVKSRHYMLSDRTDAAPFSKTPPSAAISQSAATPAWNARFSGVMVGMLVAFAVGSQAGSSILSGDEAHLPQGMPITDADSLAVSTAILAPIQTVALTESVAAKGQDIERPEATLSPDEELLAEMEEMIAQHSATKEQIDMLDYVNLALNKELLQIELAIQALETDAQKNVGVRTVYNVVNLPVGSGYAASINGSQLAQVSEVAQVSEAYDQAYYDKFENDAFATDY